VLSIAAAAAAGSESLTVSQNGRLLPFTLAESAGGRLHLVNVGEGAVDIAYTATINGTTPPAMSTPAEVITYLRPSRYCESDTLGAIARREFFGLSEAELLPSVSSWVGVRLAYQRGSSLPTDGAVSTLLAQRGVCRDFAHLVIAFLRALDVPARLASVYAPGLNPMDFHAVAEAAVDGLWRAVDATTLAPRSTLVRIATGRDASDTAFLSVRGAPVDVVDMEVFAVADVLPDDDITRLVSLQ
jgi:transglutaminase-like putative cysteine protease